MDMNQRQRVSKDVSDDVRATVDRQEFVFQRRAGRTCPVNKYVLANGKRFWRIFLVRCKGGRKSGVMIFAHSRGYHFLRIDGSFCEGGVDGSGKVAEKRIVAREGSADRENVTIGVVEPCENELRRGKTVEA